MRKIYTKADQLSQFEKDEIEDVIYTLLKPAYDTAMGFEQFYKECNFDDAKDVFAGTEYNFETEKEFQGIRATDFIVEINADTKPMLETLFENAQFAI